MKLRVAGIIKESVVDGPGIRYVIFAQGCLHNCPGCHNPQTHDLNGGFEMDVYDIIEEITKSSHISGVTFSGGEPFLQAEAFACLAEAIKSHNLNIVTYTGYTLEELLNSGDLGKINLLKLSEVLIDGKFKINERDLSLKFRGSGNQRIIDVKSSLELNSPVILY